MNEKNLILPFITKSQSQQETPSLSAEIACVVCLAEWQRKKTGLFRDTPEKLAFVSKVYYPLWLVPYENKCLAVDGLGTNAFKFSFKEPAKTEAFVENLKRSSLNHQEFMSVLDNESKRIGEFTSPSTVSLKALLSDRELLVFLQQYLGNAAVSDAIQGNGLVPEDVDDQTAMETGHSFSSFLRTLQADAKGLQYALGVLKGEAELHKSAAASEMEWLKEKCEAETALLRPGVDKAVKKLTLKHDKGLASLTRANDKRVSVLEKQREKYMRKLQAAEQRRDAAEKRRNAAKKKGSGKSGEYELERCQKEISKIKKEVNAVSDAIDKQKKQGDANVKKLEEEFRKAVQQEENKIITIKNTCDAKVAKKKQETEAIASQATAITAGLEKLMDELKRNEASLRQQVEVDWKLDIPDEVIRVLVPMYLVKYMKQKDEKYSLIAPLSVSEETGVLDGLRRILTLGSDPKMKTLARPANKNLQDLLNANVVERMQSDDAFKAAVNSVCRNNNFLDRLEFQETLNEGLDEIVKRGWMTSEEASATCKRITEAQP